MKGYLVTVTFLDGSKEGVFFTDISDAHAAFKNKNGDFDGSSLAISWADTYGESGLVMSLENIEVN